MLNITALEESYVFVNISWWIPKLKGQRQSIQLRSENSQQNNPERETWSLFQQFEMRSERGTGCWFNFQKCRRWRL